MTQKIPEFLNNQELRLIFFGGKGGVGKTTVAALSAIYLAKIHRKSKKILIMSTDPAHSLSDSLGIKTGDPEIPVSITAETCLYARELNAMKLMDRFRQKNLKVIQKLAERGTYFDREDINDFLNLSLPGMDEVMAILEMARLLSEKQFDILLVDTAPTGHTLRMLQLPGQMKRWLDVMELMQQKHRYLFRHFSRKKYRKDACDFFLENMRKDLDRVQRILSNPATTRFVPVLVPEPMIFLETRRLLKSLEAARIPVKELVINRVGTFGGQDQCPICRGRKAKQRPILKEISTAFSAFSKVEIPLFPFEIQGIPALEETADYIFEKKNPKPALKVQKKIMKPSKGLMFEPGLEFVFLGGKGGVGKTTIAASVGLRMAQRYLDKKILVFSTDPAHSLSDVFDVPVGNQLTPIPYNSEKLSGGNLYAIEIDPEGLWTEFKETFRKDMQDLFEQFLARGTDIRFDRQVMTEILELAPPGLDEIMSLNKMMDLRKEKDFDMFVLDTSPTGHLLRFLELPALVRQWLQSFFRLLMKYKGVVRLHGGRGESPGIVQECAENSGNACGYGKDKIFERHHSRTNGLSGVGGSDGSASKCTCPLQTHCYEYGGS